MNNLFKITNKFLLVFFSFLFLNCIFSIPVIAAPSETNLLSKIMVEKGENENYKVSLFFNKKFSGNAFLQKGKNSNYSVYLTDTATSSKKTNISYKNIDKNSNIKVTIEEKPYIKDDNQSSYLRLDITQKTNIPITLSVKQVTKQPLFAPNSASKIVLNIVFVFLLLCLFVLVRALLRAKKRQNIKDYTIFPASYLNENMYYEQNYENVENIKTPVLPKVNMNKTMKNVDKDSFSCFDVPLANEVKQSSFNLVSSMSQTSKNLKYKNSRQTNPMLEEASELSLPLVADLPVNNKEIEQKQENSAPELLSELKITPTKGFYLTTVDDCFALFGYVGDKVFLLQKFNDLSQINLQARFYDRTSNCDMYIVRLDSYKAMVEISDSGIRELAVL